MGWYEDMERAEQIRDAQEYECAMAYKDGYEQAVEDFMNKALEMIKSEQDTRYGYLDGADIREIARELKAGD